ncbi:hypothetical protein [Prosthecomicrobium sp. N25]|uniref:hypothetical protein n=1 Tax=Prosthecomicrobium sp. N25 TaxID=3129254 RepID=UPI0030770A34
MAQSAFVDPQNGAVPPGHPRAFPSAQGFGKIAAVRSSDRVVYRVDTLDDVVSATDGKISLRECLLASPITTPYVIPGGKPRVCVFDVAGQIVVNSAFRITVPGLYIAGQTAPAPGIEIKLGPLMTTVDTPFHVFRGSTDVIVRHMRFRLGSHNDGRPKSQNGDPFRLSMVKRVIFDHVTSMYGTDESWDMNSVEDVTAQWSIIGPNICREAGHVSTIHCKSLFIKPGQRATVFANLSQHGVHRGMNIAPGVAVRKSDGTWLAETPGQIDVVNNLIFDYTVESGLISNEFGHAYVNYVGNTVFRSGYLAPNNFPIGLYNVNAASPNGFKIYASGNSTFRTRIAGEFGQTTSDDQRLAAGLIPGTLAANVCGIGTNGKKDCSKTGTQVVSTTELALVPGVSGLSVDRDAMGTSEQATRAIAAFAGANMCRGEWCRDKTDDYFIDDFRTCHQLPRFREGGVLQIGEVGYPGYMGGSAYLPLKDTDHDGMPDDWETAHGLNPSVADGNLDADRDGYTNLEEYLSEMAKDDEMTTGVMAKATGALPAYNCGFAPVLP